MTRAQRVALVYPWPNLDTVPSLCNAACLLAEAGYLVDVFTHVDGRFRSARFTDPRIEVHFFDVAKRTDSGFVLRQSSQRAWSPLIAERHRVRPYRCIIGVDSGGLIQAAALADEVGTEFAYYSLELLLECEVNNEAARAIKSQEKVLAGRARFVVTQDPERGQVLAKDNALPTSHIVYIPNGPLGDPRRRPNRDWHHRLDLPAQSRVVIHAGHVGPLTGLDSIVRSVSSWPDPWVLVVHTRFAAESAPEVRHLQEIAEASRVYFSLDPLPRDDYEAALGGAEVGVVFYVPQPGSTYTQTNIRLIGRSSGKAAHYLHRGLPLVTNEASTLGSLVRQTGCGIAVSDAPGISRALTQIDGDYERYAQAAIRTSESEFNVRRGFADLLARL